MKEKTIGMVFVGLLVFSVVGPAMAVPGLSGTENPIPFEKNETDVSSSASFDLRNTGDGNVVLYGDGERLGTQETRPEVQGDRSTSFSHTQRDPMVTFIGQSSQSTSTTTESIDGFGDGDISEYSGTTSAFSISGGSLQFDTLGERNVEQVITRTDVTTQQGDTIDGSVGQTSGYPVDFAFYFGVQDANNAYRIVGSDYGAYYRIERIDGGTVTTLDSIGQSPPRTVQNFNINWDDNGNIDVAINGYTLNATDTTYTSGGIGWMVEQRSGGGAKTGTLSNGVDRTYTTQVNVTTTDPSMTVNGETVSYSGELADGETVTRSFSDLPAGSYTFQTSTSEGVLNHTYEANNDGRVYVSGVTVNGQNSYTVDQFVGAGDTVVLSSSFSGGTNNIDVSTNSNGELQTLTKLELDGAYDAWQAIYEGSGHLLTEEPNVVFDYTATPSSDNRIRGMNVSAQEGTTSLEVHSWAPSNADAESREIVDFKADNTVNVEITNVSSDQQYVVFRDGEQKQTLTPTDGSIEFAQYGNVEVFTKIQTDDSSLEYAASSSGVYIPSNQNGLLSWYQDTTGLPGMTLVIAGGALALFVVYLLVVRPE